MKVKTLRNYLIGLPEEFDEFFVKMTNHEITEGHIIKRSVENIHGTIARLETKEIFLLDEAGSDFFNVGKDVEEKLEQALKTNK